MRQPTSDLPAARPLRALALAAALVLLGAGAGLFFSPDAMRPHWPWDIRPFNAAFLGAAYLATVASLVVLLLQPGWAPARLVLPMLFVYTAAGLVVSLLNWSAFEQGRWTRWLWFLIHLVLPAITGLLMWRYRGLPPPYAYSTPPRWRNVLLLNALVLGLYGTGQFLAPMLLSAFWPWTVDGFHGQLYSVTFTTLAAGALGLVQWSKPSERLSLGLAYSTLGLFAVFGTVIVDASRQRVDWYAPGVWLWMGLLLAQFLLGLALIWWSSNPREPEGGP